jgi:signal transduction histidine kinase
MVIDSISRAKTELDSALESLEELHPFDPGVALYYAHALNNVLTVMCWTVDLISLEVGGSPGLPIRGHLQELSQAIDSAKEIVSDLSKSSVYTGSKFDFSLVNMSNMIVSAVDYYSKIAGRKEIELQIDGPIPNLEVWADRVGVAVVLDNLLSNAVKYTNHGGNVWVRLQEEEEFARCSVCDDGPGLTQEDLERLFQPGVRLSAVPTAGESSSGYGLAVAKKVIDTLRGEIWCDSDYGHGACFQFLLRRNPPSYLRSSSS